MEFIESVIIRPNGQYSGGVLQSIENTTDLHLELGQYYLIGVEPGSGFVIACDIKREGEKIGFHGVYGSYHHNRANGGITPMEAKKFWIPITLESVIISSNPMVFNEIIIRELKQNDNFDINDVPEYLEIKDRIERGGGGRTNLLDLFALQ